MNILELKPVTSGEKNDRKEIQSDTGDYGKNDATLKLE